ncbi:MAG: hypothetical protein ACYDHH_01450 [Solirubrobacteraceae bacterium]
MIAHTHIDGLYRFDDRAANCHLSYSTPRGAQLQTVLQFAYAKHGRALAVTAEIPVDQALLLLPPTCPAQGDSIDGLLDNYFTPGFSFDTSYGSARWFTSATVEIPLARLHRSTVVRIHLRNTRAGTPPRNCDVPNPAYERCTTTGSWSGVLTFAARP